MSVLHFNNATKIGILHVLIRIVYCDYDFSRIKVIKNLCLHGRLLYCLNPIKIGLLMSM